jgi:Rod binding domain-containing protein
MAAPISSLSPLPTVTSTPSSGKPKDAADAAKQFEAMLIAQMLHSAREEAEDDALGGGDSAGSTMLDMADQQFSKLLTDRGGLGLASVIEKSLKSGPAVAPASRLSNEPGKSPTEVKAAI